LIVPIARFACAVELGQIREPVRCVQRERAGEQEHLAAEEHPHPEPRRRVLANRGSRTSYWMSGAVAVVMSRVEPRWQARFAGPVERITASDVASPDERRYDRPGRSDPPSDEDAREAMPGTSTPSSITFARSPITKTSG
jgi:hypothetical protein